MNAFSYLLRREIWEHRALYVAPLVVAAVMLVGLFEGVVQGVGGHIGYQNLVDQVSGSHEPARSAVIAGVLLSLATPFVMVFLFVLFFYLLDSLYSERRDRSILFWKSLPVTDLSTVASKVVIAVIVAPLITVAVIAATQIVTLLISTVVAWIGGGSAWELIWKPVPLLQVWLLMLYSLVVMTLWYIPFIGWFMLASAWAKKGAFLWGILPIVGLGQLEYLTSESARFFQMLGEHAGGFARVAYAHDFERVIGADDEGVALREIAQGGLYRLMDPVGLLSSPNLWIGFLIGGVFLAGAVYLRRFRDDS